MLSDLILDAAALDGAFVVLALGRRSRLRSRARLRALDVRAVRLGVLPPSVLEEEGR